MTIDRTDDDTAIRVRFRSSYPYIARVEARFSGCDEGRIRACACFMSGGVEWLLTDQDSGDDLLDMFYDLLETAFPSWQDNAGSAGTIMWDCVNDKARIEIEQYYSTSNAWEEA